MTADRPEPEGADYTVPEAAPPAPSTIPPPPGHESGPPPPGIVAGLAEHDRWAAEQSSTRPAEPTPRVGRFALLGEVARGGMGVVYRARDEGVGRDVAVKVLHPRFRESAAAVRRFLDEALITGRLQHPNIPPVFEVGDDREAGPYLAMRLIKGRTLADLLAGGPAPQLLPAYEQVCQAVAYAHDRKVVHRDLKPHNVMVGAFGEVQVMDWGLAGGGDPTGTEVADPRGDGGYATVAGSVLGTPAFIPPEQAAGAGHSADRRADVFGLGGILCSLLTGKPPFIAATAEATRFMAAQGRLDGAFTRLDQSGADPELVALCKRCLAPDSGDRPADAGEVAGAVARLRAAADERARQAEADRAATEARAVEEVNTRRALEQAATEQRKRRRVAVGLSAVVVVALAVGAAVSFANYREADRERQNAVAEAGAKERALADLQRVSDQQNQTVRDLEASKSATEVAFLGGLLRPLSLRGPSVGLGPQEVSTLRALATFPEERVRFRILEVGLETAEGRERLFAFRKELMWAVVGLDKGSALGLRVVVRERLTSRTTGPAERLACACWVAELPPVDDGLDGAAARAVSDQLAAEKDPVAVGRLVGALSVLAVRLDSDEAGPLARAVADRMAKEQDPVVFGHLALPSLALAVRLGPDEAGPLARAVADRMAAEKRLNAGWQLSGWLKVLAVRLGPDEAGPPARAVADRMAKEQDPNACFWWADALSELAGGLGADQAGAITGPRARAVADRLATEKDAAAVRALAQALSALAVHLGPDEAGRLARAVADRMAKEQDAAAVGRLAGAVSALAGGLGDAELVSLFKSLGVFANIREAALAEFGRRSCRTQTPSAAAAAGAAVVFSTPSPPFKEVWDFVDWAEKHRPDFDLKSRPKDLWGK
jgi:hypothetical protein